MGAVSLKGTAAMIISVEYKVSFAQLVRSHSDSAGAQGADSGFHMSHQVKNLLVGSNLNAGSFSIYGCYSL